VFDFLFSKQQIQLTYKFLIFLRNGSEGGSDAHSPNIRNVGDDEEKISREIGASFSLQKSFEETHVTPWGAEQQFAYFVFGRA
jgi:hypothetical protein